MRWYEYKMEVDDLHASDDLKAKLLAMQPAEEAPKPARKPKKAIHFPRKTLSIAACGLLCGVGLYAAVHSPFSLLPAGGAALSSAPETASYAAAYSMDDVNSALAAPKMAVPAGGSADAMSDRDAGGTGTLSAEAAQTSTKLIYTANLTIESKDFDAARTALTELDIRALIERGGVLRSRKSAALPGVEISLPAMTAQDRENLALAPSCGVTAVMQPFVRSADDLKAVRAAMNECGGTDIRLFAKIENCRGMDALAELLPHADEIVIARGDLGNAVPLWELPAVQKRIAARCRENGTPFMVVTQMLASMEHSRVPTRAEMSDIFNAVLDGAASVMVTGETAAGEYPADVIRYLALAAHAAETFLKEK